MSGKNEETGQVTWPTLIGEYVVDAADIWDDETGETLRIAYGPDGEQRWTVQWNATGIWRISTENRPS